MPKKILIALSEWGYWGEELVGPLEVLDQKRIPIRFCYSKGKPSSGASAKHAGRLF